MIAATAWVSQKMIDVLVIGGVPAGVVGALRAAKVTRELNLGTDSSMLPLNSW